METATPTSQVHALPNAAAEPELPISANAMAALSYAIGIVAIFALAMRDYQKNAHVRFAATQSLLFLGTWMVGYVAIVVVFGILTAIANVILGALKLYALMGLVFAVSPLLTLLFSLGMLGTLVALVVTAAQGKKLKLPVLGGFAERFASR